jgi:hypothetical protein
MELSEMLLRELTILIVAIEKVYVNRTLRGRDAKRSCEFVLQFRKFGKQLFVRLQVERSLNDKRADLSRINPTGLETLAQCADRRQ